jgi:hypothetical protein
MACYRVSSLGGGVGSGGGAEAAPLLITQVQGITYLQVQAPGDDALPQHVQPVEVLCLAHEKLLAVGMALQGEQAAAQQVGLPLGHKSIQTRSPVLMKAGSVVSSMQ